MQWIDELADVGQSDSEHRKVSLSSDSRWKDPSGREAADYGLRSLHSAYCMRQYIALVKVKTSQVGTYHVRGSSTDAIITDVAAWTSTDD
jgi:hypothetical protein